MADLDKLLKKLEVDPVHLDSVLSTIQSWGSTGRLLLPDAPVDTDFGKPAPNLIEFVVRPDYLGVSTLYPTAESKEGHVRQYQILRDFFQLRCPICNSTDLDDIDCWGKGREYFESEALLVWNAEFEDDRCPKCGNVRQELVEDGLLKSYTSMTGIAGMRSGKSKLAGMIACYVEHRLINLGGIHHGDLQKFFNRTGPFVTGNEEFDIGFVATTAEQSEETVYKAYRNLRAASNWFDAYIKWVKFLEKTQPVVIGKKKWRYKEDSDLEIDNELLGVKFSSLHSNSASLAGRTRLWVFIDEISRFDTTESKRSAGEVYHVLNKSLKTATSIRDRMARHWLYPILGARLAISSPISRDDQGWQLLEKAQQGRIPTMFFFHYPTWDFNPLQPREGFAEDFELDPVRAERDFGANPPYGLSLWVDDRARFEQAIDAELKPSVVLAKTYPVDSQGRVYVGCALQSAELDRSGVPHYVWLDSSATFDCFSIVCGYPVREQVEDPGPSQPKQELVTVYDFVYRLIPEPGTPRREVHFDTVVQVVGALKQFFTIARVGFDRWNSVQAIQQVRDYGIPAQPYPLKRQDFIQYRVDAYSGKVRLLPRNPDDAGRPERQQSPQTVAVNELLKLQDDGTGIPTNPKKGKVRGENSDDLAQGMVGVHKLILMDNTLPVENQGQTSIQARKRNEESGSGSWGRQHMGSIGRFRRW